MMATAVHYAARQRRGGVAAASEGGAGDACNPGEANQLTEAATLGLRRLAGGARGNSCLYRDRPSDGPKST
jgi:hypothetical protein